MKKLLFIIILGIYAGMIAGFSQGITIYPIPSSGVEVNGFANFQETGTGMSLLNPQGKRAINVMVTTSYPGHQKVQATVWFYSLDSLEMMGPYTTMENDILSESIDFKAWGALIESDDDVLVSVWIGGDSQPLLMRKGSRSNSKRQ